MIEVIGRSIDVCVIITKIVGELDLANISRVFCVKSNNLFINIAKRIAYLIYARSLGYKKYYVHYSYTNVILVSLITKILGGKSYMWQCGLHGKYYMHEWDFTKNNLEKKIFNDFPLLVSYKLCDYLVTGTDIMANYYHKTFRIDKSKIVVIPNWVNLNRFDPNKFLRNKIRDKHFIPHHSFLILFIHWLSKRKGVNHIPVIASSILNKYNDVLFIVIGDGPYKNKLKNILETTQLDSSVLMKGAIPNKDILEYYIMSDLFILPSEEEGFPRVLLECMAMGVPFVTMNVGGIRDIITENQKRTLIRNDDLDNFINKIEYLMNNECILLNLKLDGINHVKKYDIKNVAKIFLNKIFACDGE